MNLNLLKPEKNILKLLNNLAFILFVNYILYSNIMNRAIYLKHLFHKQKANPIPLPTPIETQSELELIPTPIETQSELELIPTPIETPLELIPTPIETPTELITTPIEIKQESILDELCETVNGDQYTSQLDTEEEPILNTIEVPIIQLENIIKSEKETKLEIINLEIINSDTILESKNLLEYKKAKKQLNKLLKKNKEYARYINNINKSYSKKNYITKNNIFI